jgi:hypothetical protein
MALPKIPQFGSKKLRFSFIEQPHFTLHRQAIGLSIDFNGSGMVQQSIQNSCGDGFIRGGLLFPVGDTCESFSDPAP